MDKKENNPLNNKDLEKVTGGYPDDSLYEDSDGQKDDEEFIPVEVVLKRHL